PISELMDAAAVQLAESFHQGGHRVAQLADAVLQSIELLNAFSRFSAAEDLRLDLVQLALQSIKHRKVTVGHGVEQRVGGESGAFGQQVRLAFRPRADAGKVVVGVTANGDHVARSREHVHLADDELTVNDLDEVQHEEQRIAVFLDLRPLLAAASIVDGELV